MLTREALHSSPLSQRRRRPSDLQRKGSAVLVTDIDARNQLVDEALALIKDKQRQNDMSANVKQLAAPHSARRIVELMESIISQ